MAKRWAGLAIVVGSRLAAMPRTLAQMPKEVWDKLGSRGTNISPEALYDLIPAGVKTRTDDVLAFLGKRDLSHILPKYLRPDLADDPSNVLFEKSWWNRRRGWRNMKRWEVTRARLDNFAEGVVKGARATTVAAARGAILGALMELPVTAAENLVLVKGRGKTRREAWKDVARDVGKSAATGAAGTVVATGIAMIGVSMAPAVAVPIAVVGSTLYTWSAAERIWKARARVGSSDAPTMLEETGLDALNPARLGGNQGRLKNLYVIRLDHAVLQKRKFRERNPHYRPRLIALFRKPCVYVGFTSHDPAVRFEQHKGRGTLGIEDRHKVRQVSHEEEVRALEPSSRS